MCGFFPGTVAQGPQASSSYQQNRDAKTGTENEKLANSEVDGGDTEAADSMQQAQSDSAARQAGYSRVCPSSAFHEVKITPLFWAGKMTLARGI